MRRKEVYEKLTGGQEVNADYLLGVWSKVKFGEELSEERIREKLQLRF